jgi:hypothetical protein
VLLDTYEPPVVPLVETVEVSPTAKELDVADNVPASNGVIVSSTSSVILQPKSSVNVSVYIIGRNALLYEEVGAAIDASSKSVVGDQEKVTPLPVEVPLNATGTPEHVVASGYEDVNSLILATTATLASGQPLDAA